jgi:hypothetical protein
MAQNLDLATHEICIFSASWTGTYEAFNLNAKFIAYLLSKGEHSGTIWIAYHLHKTFAITQVNKDNSTMVTAAINPTSQGDFCTNKYFRYLTAGMASHRHNFPMNLYFL